MTKDGLERRIGYLAKVLSWATMLFGLAIILAQLGKAIQAGWSLSLGAAAAMGLLLVALGWPGKIERMLLTGATRQKLRAKICVFLVPLVLSTAVTLWRVNITRESWKRVESEGGLFEHGTALAYLLAFIIAFPIARHFQRAGATALALAYFALTAAFLFVALEELSWGQHLFGWPSPDFFRAYSSQQETSLHNLVWVNAYIDYGYWALGLIGGLAWLLIPLVRRWPAHLYVIPGWYLSSFFLLVLYTYVLRDYGQDVRAFFQGLGLEALARYIVPLGEFAELLLGMGFLAFMIVVTIRQGTGEPTGS